MTQKLLHGHEDTGSSVCYVCAHNMVVIATRNPNIDKRRYRAVAISSTPHPNEPCCIQLLHIFTPSHQCPLCEKEKKTAFIIRFESP